MIFINDVPYVPGKKDNIFLKVGLNEEIGIYAPHRNPYPALTIVPTAEICPWVFKNKFIIEDKAVPNNTNKNISNIINKISLKVINQPIHAI